MNISEYDIEEKVFTGARFVLYRGFHKKTNQKVLVKTIKRTYPGMDEVSLLKNEFRIGNSIHNKGSIRYIGIKEHYSQPALILENFGGITLKEFIEKGCGDLSVSLKISIQLSGIMENLHRKNILHNNIHPENILIDTSSHEIRIMDFSAATDLKTDVRTKGDNRYINEYLHYISPEQTGRINRSVDFRSDLYSLGILLYELFAQTSPFHSQDPSEIIYFHIAKKPVPPSVVNDNIPETLSSIILKLLEKDPENRYQQASALSSDLHKCFLLLQESGTIACFPIGEYDSLHRFEIHSGLCSREKELETLTSIFNQVCNGNQGMAMVAGYSGVGKSSLVTRFQEEISGTKSYFIRGKFEIQKKDQPYYGLIKAFEELVQKILTDKEACGDRWKSLFLNALGVNAGLITAVIPSLELILGKQPSAEELPPDETTFRFNGTVKNFIQTIARKEHPLILFLDDLQWADTASLQLLETITGSDLKHIFIIGSYRENEITTAHPLFKVLERIRTRAQVHTLLLEPLPQKAVIEIVSATLGCDEVYALPLAELVFLKTQGNPFFLREFLHSLFQEKLLKFNTITCRWEYDADAVQKFRISDNVADLMVYKLNKLSPETLHLIKTAACIGTRFDILTLALTRKKEPYVISDLLQEALASGLIVPAGERERSFVKEEGALLIYSEKPGSYIFLHDRVLQSASSMIDNNEKKQIHLTIGRLKSKSLSYAELNEEIFEIVNHLNFSSDLISTAEEKFQLVELNYLAGKKARTTSAFEAAFGYFKEAIKHLPEHCWNEHFDFTFNIYAEAAECEYLVSNISTAIEKFDLLLSKAKTPKEKIRIYEKKCRLYIKRGDFIKAFETANECLRIFDIQLPKKKAVIKLQIIKEILFIKLMLKNRKASDLLNHREMKDQEKIDLLHFLETFSVSAYQYNPDLFALIMLKAMKISLKYGNSRLSPPSYMGYGIILSIAFKNYTDAYQFGRLAMDLTDKFGGGNALKIRMLYPYLNFLAHLREDVRTLFPTLRNVYNGSLENGDPLYSGYALITTIWNKITLGYNLQEVLQESEQYIQYFTQRKEEDLLEYVLSRHQLILALTGKTVEPASIESENYNVPEKMEKLIKSGSLSTLAITYISRIQLLFLFGKYEEGVKISIEAEKYLSHINNLYITGEYYLYQSLTLLARYPESALTRRMIFLKLIRRNRAILKKLSGLNPSGYKSQYLLLEAQFQHIIRKKSSNAIKLFDEAIETAREFNFTQNEGLANELAAELFIGQERLRIARMYLKEAYHAYDKWGATEKVLNLEIKYKKHLMLDLGEETAAKKNSGIFNGAMQYIDLNSLMKASTVISKETELEKLLKRLMKIGLENAGAEYGIFMIERDGQLLIEAEGAINQEEVITYKDVPSGSSNAIPQSIIAHVSQSRESLVIPNAATDSKFFSDPYIREKKVKSVLCIPIESHTSLVGILYLENNLSNGAFTPERIELLRLLSGQIAVSIENSLLQEKKFQAYREREQLLQKINRHQKKLASKIIKTQESERKRIAEDLHDGMGYILSTFKLHFTSFLESNDENEKKKFLSSCYGLLEDSFTELKSVSNNLMPSIVFDNGLVAGIEDLCYRINKAGKINIRFNYFNIKRLSTEFEIIVFRVIQELINNVLKHSEARHLELQFVYYENELVITADDDGKGFDYAETLQSRKGKGLLHIVNRLKFLGGVVEYNSKPGQGTSVIIKLPISKLYKKQHD